jgi:hypothetical protein
MNEDDLNAMEPLPWYKRRRPWLLVAGFAALAILAQLLLQPA